jgi:putative ABC transport system substrate-binding protein
MTARRRVLLALAALATGNAFAQARPAKIGVLLARHPSFYAPGIVQRLAEQGYRAGSSMQLEQRSADGVPERFAPLARELVDAKCDLIFAVGPEHPVRALQNAAAPAVVFIAVDFDPVERGIVANFRTPDRNTTGIYIPQAQLAVKRLELMREIIPSVRRLMVLSDVFSRDQVPAVRKVADAAGIDLMVIEFAKSPYDLAGAFEKAREARVEGLIGVTSPVLANRAGEIGALLLSHRLPGIGWSIEDRVMASGFVIGYGDSPLKVSRRAADIGIRILKGIRPANIPVEQSDEFELFINAKVAQTLGVRIPPAVMARALHIIQ